MTTWLTLAEAAHYAKAGKRCLYAAVRDGRLKAARINQRGDLRFTPEWLDAWLVEMTATRWKATRAIVTREMESAGLSGSNSEDG
jgi:excisionase family DNA binding protein